MSEFIGDRILRLLKENGHTEVAEELSLRLLALKSEIREEREEASARIQGCCQMRVYGDLNIAGVNGWKWNSMLQKLKNYAAKKSK
jgi:hypothetical protein